MSDFLRPTRRLFHRLAGACALGLATVPLRAQTDWPSRPIRIVSPSPAGVGSDAFARVYADRLGKALGTPVFVENKPGALSTIGADLVAKAAPDGYTLLFSTGNPFTLSPHLLSRLPYQPERDFVPVARLYGGGSFVVANNDAPFQTLPELVARAKEAPGKIAFASYGPGSTAHLGFELLQDAAGIELLHVPYRSAIAMNDVVAGQVLLGWEPPVSALPFLRAGKLRAIAFSGHKRSASLPDVPAIAETYPGVELLSWVGVWAPAGTPDAIVQRLRQELAAITQSPQLEALFQQVGSESMLCTPQEMAVFMRRESDSLGRLIRAKNIRIS